MTGTPDTPRQPRTPEKGEVIIAEAVVLEDPDLALHTRAGFGHVGSGELVIIYLVHDYERYTLEEDGSVAVLYIGQRYDASTLEKKGQPKRSNDPDDLRHWWTNLAPHTSPSDVLASYTSPRKANGTGGENPAGR